jgi:ferredoxin
VPLKYHIPTGPVANRFKPIIRSGVIAWEEGCLKCAKCVKKECVYDVYEKRSLDGRQMLDSLDSVCQDCFRCVQGCPNKLIHKGLNPYKALGDEYWTPEILSNIWYQAETGRIPVSRPAMAEPFSGPGFDAMWTDMSEIVRPTRDGIHGREYISTLVDLGRKVKYLSFPPRANCDLLHHPWWNTGARDLRSAPGLLPADGSSRHSFRQQQRLERSPWSLSLNGYPSSRHISTIPCLRGPAMERDL